jgi:hypothetical protein
MEDQKTAKGYAMARDMATGRQGIPWTKIKEFEAGYALQAVQCAGANRTEDIVLTDGERKIEIAISDLKGRVRCYPVVDEGIPESWTQKSQKVQQLMANAGTNPAIMAILQQPQNQEVFKDFFGVEEIYIPGAASREKALWEIQELLKSTPVPGPMAVNPQTGQPAPSGPPQSSINVDLVFDDVASEFAVYKEWMNSEEARVTKIENPDGYQNVRLHGTELFQAQQQLAAQAAPKPKPPSMSVNVADMPPDVQAQMLALDQIKANPQTMAAAKVAGMTQ